MIVAWIALAHGGSAGVQAGVLAFRGAARHDLSASIGAWGRAQQGLWNLTVDGQGAARGRADRLFAHRTVQGRLGLTVGPGTGDERVHIGLGLGPALVVRHGAVGERSFVRVEPALRLLTHLDLRIARTPLALRWQVGGAVRGLRRWDADVSLGLGAWL